MTSTVNGGNEDLNKAEGHIELRIDNLTGFAQEKEGSERLSEPVYVRGMPWKILAGRSAFGGEKYLSFFLQCNTESTDPLWSCSATAEMKVLARQEGSVDHVRELYHIFHAKENHQGFALTLKELMKPDKGWYDEQADCIVLAVDLKADVVERIGEFILVAENELKLGKASTSVSMRIGQLEWQFKLTTIKNMKKLRLVTVSCLDMMMVADGMDGNNSKVALELFGYHQQDDPKSETYSPFSEKLVLCHYFTAKNNSLTILRIVNFPEGCDHILLNVHMLRERSLFPDFTKETAKVGCIPADIKLRVDDHVFHANKLLLCFHSDYFDRMFNGGYKEANQQEIELKHEEAKDPALFHDFLLVMCVPEVLPSTRNVVGLLKLAQHYQAEEVTEKCMNHLRICREMPLEQRVLLTGEYGDKQSRAFLLDNLSNAESKQMNAILLEKLFTLYSPQK